jgi:hypothetical protein
MFGLMLSLLSVILLCNINFLDPLISKTSALDSSSLCLVALVSSSPANAVRAPFERGQSTILLTVVLFGGRLSKFAEVKFDHLLQLV